MVKSADEIIHDNAVKEIVEKIRSECAKTAQPVPTALTIVASVAAAVMVDAIKDGHGQDSFDALILDINEQVTLTMRGVRRG